MCLYEQIRLQRRKLDSTDTDMKKHHTKNAHMMSFGMECKTPFDDNNYIFELMPDGCRCLAYVSGDSVTLLDDRGAPMHPRFPEFAALTSQVEKPCVLDGHIVVYGDVLPDFYACACRLRTVSERGVRNGAEKFPATFIVQDILQYNGNDLAKHPLAERKNILKRNVAESDSVSVARHNTGLGKALYGYATDMELPGVVGKHMDGFYYTGTVSPDWVGFRTSLEDDYIICGYIRMGASSAMLVLGKYDPAGVIAYSGLVTMRNNPRTLAEIRSLRPAHETSFHMAIPQDIVEISWVEPSLVCSVRFLSRNEQGMVQAPTFNGLRRDISPDAAVARATGNQGKKTAAPGAVHSHERKQKSSRKHPEITKH